MSRATPHLNYYYIYFLVFNRSFFLLFCNLCLFIIFLRLFNVDICQIDRVSNNPDTESMVVVVDVVDDLDTVVKGTTFSHAASSSSNFPSAARSSIRLSSSDVPICIRPLDADATVEGDEEDDVVDHVKSPPRKNFVIT